MLKYILKRLGLAVLAMFIVMTIVFFLVNSTGQTPLSATSSKDLEAVKTQLDAFGFNDPLIVRYGRYWQTLFSGSLGTYYSSPNQTIDQIVFGRVPNTLYVVLISFFIGSLLGIIFGMISGLFRGKLIDAVINVLVVLFVSIPSFVVGLGLLKAAGLFRLPPRFINFDDANFNFGNFLLASIIPILSLVFYTSAAFTYRVRNEVVEVMNQDYIKTARSKGLSTFAVALYHIFRNSIIPSVPLFVFGISGAFSGGFIIESLFGVQGVSRILIDSVQSNETNLVMFNIMFIQGIPLLASVFIELIYVLVDPRIRIASAGGVSLWTKLKFVYLRQAWLRKWRRINHTNSHNVLFNSPQHRQLLELKAIDYKHNTISLTEQQKTTLKIEPTANFVLLGTKCLKIITIHG